MLRIKARWSLAPEEYDVYGSTISLMFLRAFQTHRRRRDPRLYLDGVTETSLPMARHAVGIKGAIEANDCELLDDGLRDD